MARFEDAKAGWGIFKNANYSLTRDEINAHLMARGLFPISERTYRHYFKLRRYGYLRYIPINQLDVKTLKDPLWDKAVRNRYSLFQESVEVSLMIPVHDSVRTISGKTLEISPSSVVCRFASPEALEILGDPALRRSLVTQRASLFFPHSREVFAASIDNISFPTQADVVVVTLGFVSMAALELISRKQPLPNLSVQLRFVPTTSHTAFTELVRKLYWLFQTFESSRLVMEDLLVYLGAHDDYVVPSTTIRYLRMQSPLQAELLVAMPIALFVLQVSKYIVDMRKSYHEGSLAREQARKLKRQNDNDELLMKYISSQLLEEVSDELSQLTNHPKPKAHKPVEEELDPITVERIRKQVLLSLKELLDESTGTIELTQKKGDENE